MILLHYRNRFGHMRQICEGEWVKTRGGKRPLNPPSIFPGVPKSCLKQIQSKERCTKASSAETRRENHEATNEARDQLINFKNFLKEIKRYFPLFSFVNDGADLTLFRTDKMGREIVVFIHFQEVVSPFGFLKLVTAERNGMEVPKQFMNIPRNSLVYKWSMVKEIVDKLFMYEPSNEDYFHKSTKSITSMDSLFDSSKYQFLLEQFHLLLLQTRM